MSGRVPLAELARARLDGPTLDALEADLAQLTRVLEVQVKGAPTVCAAGAAPDLAAALAQLRAGAVRGVQVRYAYRGEVWCDTLLAGPAGIRLVRLRAPGL